MGEIATEKVYVTDANGINRLVAAPGDVVPDSTPTYGVTTRRDGSAGTALPFEGYDELSEADVVARLADLTPDQLEAVKAYERTHLARGAIHTYGDHTTPVTVPRRGRRNPPKATPASTEQ